MINGYADDKVILAKIFAKYQRRKDIKAFLENFINNAKDLRYSDTKIEYMDETEVYIRNKKKMYIKEGITTNET